MRRVEGRASDPVPWARLMQDPANDLRRIPLLGTWVNAAVKKPRKRETAIYGRLDQLGEVLCASGSFGGPLQVHHAGERGTAVRRGRPPAPRARGCDGEQSVDRLRAGQYTVARNGGAMQRKDVSEITSEEWRQVVEAKGWLRQGSPRGGPLPALMFSTCWPLTTWWFLSISAKGHPLEVALD
jgi:hypothetical protein